MAKNGLNDESHAKHLIVLFVCFSSIVYDCLGIVHSITCICDWNQKLVKFPLKWVVFFVFTYTFCIAADGIRWKCDVISNLLAISCG